jgi:hypothetical protein
MTWSALLAGLGVGLNQARSGGRALTGHRGDDMVDGHNSLDTLTAQVRAWKNTAGPAR